MCENEGGKKNRKFPEFVPSNPSSVEATILLSPAVSWQSADKRWKWGGPTAKTAAFNSRSWKEDFPLSSTGLHLVFLRIKFWILKTKLGDNMIIVMKEGPNLLCAHIVTS